MKLLSSLAPVSLLAATVSATKNILLTNDDGWAATNIRALYRELKAADYNVLLVASAEQWSGNGGRFILPSGNTLERPAIFNYPTEGSPAWGYEEDDQNVWYFNGSPAACVALGLDYIIPNYFPNVSIDLIVGGPNEGNNLGERDYTISATIGSMQYAVERGYPAIALSGADSNNSFFKDNLDDDDNHSFNIYAKYSVELINELFASQGDAEYLLPLATGLNVNFPKAGSDLSSDCTSLSWRHTRLTGSSVTDYAISYNATLGNVEWASTKSDGVYVCAEGNGDCSLPDEFTIIDNGACEATISVFTIDGDAPIGLTKETYTLFSGLIGQSA